MFRVVVCLAWLVGSGWATDLFQYDRAAPLHLNVRQTAGRNGYKLHDIEYAAKTSRMAGYLVVPNTPGRKPAIVWMHSSGPQQFLGDAVLLAQAGAVSLLIDLDSDWGRFEDAEAYRDAMIQCVVGIRRGVDVLAAREDVDPRRIGYVGHSFGAMMGAVAVSVDDRFRAAVFEVGLLGMSIHIGTSPHPWPEGLRKQLGPRLKHYLEVVSVVDATHYIGRAPAIPKLFQSAWYDPGVPHKDAEDFYNAASGPKQIKWYDTGHDVDDVGAILDRARFLGKALALPRIRQAIRAKTGP